MKAAELKKGDCDEKEEEGKEEKQDTCDENPHASKHKSHKWRFRDFASVASAAPASSADADASASAAWLLPLLMERILNYFDGAEPPDAGVDPDLALQLLDASAGDIDVAAGFFWDNYLANASRLSPAKRQQDASSSAKRKRADSSSSGLSKADPYSDADADTSAQNDHQNQNYDDNEGQGEAPDHEALRAIRQYLQGRLNHEDGPHVDIHDVDHFDDNPPQPPAPHMGVAAVNPPVVNNNQVADDDEMHHAGQMPNADGNVEAIAGSVSVSDDEG